MGINTKLKICINQMSANKSVKKMKEKENARKRNLKNLSNIITK